MKKGVRFLFGLVIIVASLTCTGIGVAFSQDISRDAADLAPYGATVQPNGSTITLVAHERDGTLDAGLDCAVGGGDDVIFKYLTFGHDTDPSTGMIPGPFIRVREGDTHTLRLVNPAGNAFTHSIDFHAIKGFRGGATVLMADPGSEASLEVTLNHPGLFVYHCVGDGALVNIAKHIAHGMYGLILVEPKKGGKWFKKDLRKADKEFYIMRGEFYVDDPTCCEPRDWDVPKLVIAHPDYVVFNGRAGVSWASGLPLPCAPPVVMNVNVGNNVIIYLGNIGPNGVCSPHIIGDIFDREYHLADVLSKPLRNVQTTVVPAAAATVLAFKPLVATTEGGESLILDHSIAGAAKGALGVMVVSP